MHITIHDRSTTYALSTVVVLLLVLLPGCPAPTPGERVKQLGGRVTQLGVGVIDLDLSNTALGDGDFSYVHCYCGNDPASESVNVLDLTNTAITDRFLEDALLQNGFISAGGPRELVLTGTNTSAAVVRKYQSKYPECKIVHASIDETE